MSLYDTCKYLRNRREARRLFKISTETSFAIEGIEMEIDWYQDHEICQRCGLSYESVYHVPSSLWRKVSGSKNGEGLLCMTCFGVLAKQKNICLYWECNENNFPTEHCITMIQKEYD